MITVKPVGYILYTTHGRQGESGIFYNYVIGVNGVFLEAENAHIRARVWVAPGEIRGLGPLKEEVELRHGKIPRRLYDLALITFAGAPTQEFYVAVTWEGEYRLHIPLQERSCAQVRYETIPNTVLDIHSHAGMSAGFSGQDDRDEQGLQLYGVVGRMDTLLPEAEFRAGVYGYFAPLEMEDIFNV